MNATTDTPAVAPDCSCHAAAPAPRVEAAATLPQFPGFTLVVGGFEVSVRPVGEAHEGEHHTPTTTTTTATATSTSVNPATTRTTRAAGAVAGQPAAGAACPPAPLLARHFLSTHERFILLTLAAAPGCRANDVLAECRVEVEPSRFWSLWANLQHRGLIGDVDEPKRGFQVAGEWVLDLLAAR